MKLTITNRISSLREWLKSKNLEAIIIPTADPHLSEYVAPHWKIREWISGFTGSAGTVVITRTEAGLWTDSRYFLQATQELEGTSIKLYKEMLPETPSIADFICTRLSPEDRLGIDGKLFSVNQIRDLQKNIKQRNIIIDNIADPMNSIWIDRPPIPLNTASLYDIKYAGISSPHKIKGIRAKLKEKNCDSTLISALDEIAWTLNIRGCDVQCNPVVISYLFIDKDEVHYFIDPVKVTPELQAYFKEVKVILHNYSEIENFLQCLKEKIILVDPSKTNYTIYSQINSSCHIEHQASPVSLLKAIRNKQEIVGIHSAMQRDGVALVKFLMWLEKAVPSGNETEISVSNKLQVLRSEQELYKGDSFETIAGYMENAAVVHYEATPDTNKRLQAKGFLLIDSGAQYLDGTTDITRTIALGELTEEEKTDYTLILKGHIALATAVFPSGTRGTQLDVLARMPIWKKHMNYLHGTGHGVGHYLNVHEGPQSIRMNENPVALQEGMVTSNEPGVYKSNSHGIRIENLTLVVSSGEGMFGNYLEFETLTLCPICTKGINKKILIPEEIAWLNSYHNHVYEMLSPTLNESEKEWLKIATQKI